MQGDLEKAVVRGICADDPEIECKALASGDSLDECARAVSRYVDTQRLAQVAYASWAYSEAAAAVEAPAAVEANLALAQGVC